MDFDVFDRHLVIRDSYLLEASAGTGKTHAIENIAVRLLIEEDLDKQQEPLTIDQLLIVTFTRAATHELKQRVRLAIARMCHHLDLLSKEPSPSLFSFLPDFLVALYEKGAREVARAKRRLESALFCFDQAQIATIHGFCAHLLKEYGFESNVGFSSLRFDEEITAEDVFVVIRDFFRTEMRAPFYSPAQLQIILKKYQCQQGEIEPLEKALYRAVVGGFEVQASASFSKLLEAFNQSLAALRKEGYLSKEKICADFAVLAPSFKGTCNREGKLLPDLLAKVERFAGCFESESCCAEQFDFLIRDGLAFVEALDPLQLKSRGKAKAREYLHYPFFKERVEEMLSAIVKEASDPLAIFSRMAFDCRVLFKRFCLHEEKMLPDDLLHGVAKAMQSPRFVAAVQQKYRAVIIDEFQDTDPLQWYLFKNLFISSSFLYLVGDPKQSIYAFRQADIYTYLSAAGEIAKENRRSLGINYRSQPKLVEALNFLLCERFSPGLIALPQLKQHLPYQKVKAAPTTRERFFNDNKGTIHFFVASAAQGRAKKWPTASLEEEQLFPYIAREIVQLSQSDRVALSQCAILVRDRFQAGRLAEHLKQWRIPALLQQSENLSHTLALAALQALLQALLYPDEMSYVKLALGSRLFGWTQWDICTLTNHDKLAELCSMLHRLREALFAEPFILFFQKLMQLSCKNKAAMTMLERLLGEEEGELFYGHLLQLAELLTDYQRATQASPEALLRFIQQVADEKIELKGRRNFSHEGVQIMTLHMCKGLQFDIVFALGLVNRLAEREELVPLQKGEKKLLTAPLAGDKEAYQLFQEESDAEKMRQFYVAITRARHRLYIPVALTIDAPLVALGAASPMDLFLAVFNQPPSTCQERYRRLEEQKGDALRSFIAKQAAEVTASITYEEIKEEIAVQPLPWPAPIVLNPAVCFVPPTPEKSYGAIVSFSSLQRKKEEKKIEKVSAAPLAVPKKEQLPLGSDTGTLLHFLLQHIPFGAVKEMRHFEELISLVSSYLKGHPLQGWQSAIAEIIFNALKLPFLPEDPLFCLAELKKSDCYFEMEFLYPQHEVSFVEGSFLKGYIDFIFKHRNRYYLIDWKSNWLGKSPEEYNQQKMALTMEVEGYHLQAAIYKEALRRYLSLAEKRPFDSCFGGIYYFFLRGINPKHKECGICNCSKPEIWN